MQILEQPDKCFENGKSSSSKLNKPLIALIEPDIYGKIQDRLQDKIQLSNVGLETARLVVVLERHKNPEDKQLFGLALGLLGSKEHDRLLVECPQGKISEGVYGWDHPKRDEWYRKAENKNTRYKKVAHTLTHLAEYSFPEREYALEFAVKVINKSRKPQQEVIFRDDFTQAIKQPEKDDLSFTWLQNHYSVLADTLCDRRLVRLVNTTFQERQKYLLESLHFALEQASVRKVFVHMGRAHADQEFIAACQKYAFVILSNST